MISSASGQIFYLICFHRISETSLMLMSNLHLPTLQVDTQTSYSVLQGRGTELNYLYDINLSEFLYIKVLEKNSYHVEYFKESIAEYINRLYE